jgi:hypothetical protein
VAQIAWSHHWIDVDGQLVRHSTPYRYVWPSELDLMAKITGFRVRDRWAGWDRASFTSGSYSQVAVFGETAIAGCGHAGAPAGCDGPWAGSAAAGHQRGEGLTSRPPSTTQAG